MRDHRCNRLGFPSLAAVFPFASAAVLFVACRDPKLGSTGCSTDADCGKPASAYRCETQTGVCYCRTDEACLAREFCNIAGFCQDKSGCVTNEDCVGSNLFCETSTGVCVSSGYCTSDLHCNLGFVCDFPRRRCIEGCRGDGDCPGVSCRCGDLPCACTGKTQQQLETCPIGVCDPTFCSSAAFCPYGQICGIPEDAGVQRNQCYSDYDPNRRPYCDRCTFGGGDPVCGRGPNFCLVDTARGGAPYCGADCSAGQPCPSGYACQDVIVVGPPWTPLCGLEPCDPNPNVPCLADGGCPRGGQCVAGECAAPCDRSEGDDLAFCGCMIDSDCAPETCSLGECTISRSACITDQDCLRIHCVDFGGFGGCFIGENCAPANGLTCVEVK